MFVYMLVILSLHAVCFIMLSMLRSIFSMCCLARSTCFYACLYVYLSFIHALCFMPCFPMFCSYVCSMLILGLHSHACIMSMVMPCLNLHVYMHVSMPICLDLCFHMLVCYDLCSLHDLYYLPCACALHAMFMCLGLDLVCHAMCYSSPFVPFISFSFVLA